MKLAQLPTLFSKGDLIQAQLEKMGVGQKKAAKAGAIADLMSGDINGYYKNMFESKTGYDPGRLGGALLPGALQLGLVAPGQPLHHRRLQPLRRHWRLWICLLTHPVRYRAQPRHRCQRHFLHQG